VNTDNLTRERDGNLLVAASRVSLQTIVTARRRGETPEAIQENFPTLSLAEVYGTLTYYFEHRDELDARFAEEQRVLDELDAANRAAHADFFDAMRARFAAAHAYVGGRRSTRRYRSA
jgi:uncharacterized protein (DUF433 family)